MIIVSLHSTSVFIARALADCLHPATIVPASYMDALNKMQAMIGSQSNINAQEESKEQEPKINRSTQMLKDAVQNNRFA